MFILVRSENKRRWLEKLTGDTILLSLQRLYTLWASEILILEFKKILYTWVHTRRYRRYCYVVFFLLRIFFHAWKNVYKSNLQTRFRHTDRNMYIVTTILHALLRYLWCNYTLHINLHMPCAREHTKSVCIPVQCYTVQILIE